MAETISGASLSPIYNRLNAAPQYHPLEADTFSDWCVEAGDIVTVSRDGQNYKSPVSNSKLVWKGMAPKVTVNSTGNEKRDTIEKMSRKKYGKGSGAIRNSGKFYNYEVNQDHLLYEVYDENGKFSKLNVTVEGLHHEVYDPDGRFSILSNTVDGLHHEVYDPTGKFSVLENTTDGLYNEVWDPNTGIKKTLSTQGQAITAEVTRATEKDTELEGKIIVEAGRVGLTVTVTDNREIVYYPKREYFPAVGDPTKIYMAVYDSKYYEWSNGQYVLTTPGQKINAGGIVTEINSSNEVTTRINSDKVYIGNEKSTTVINGKLNVADLDAQHIAAALLDSNVISTSYMFSRSFEVGSGSFVMDDFTCYIPDAIYDLQITQSGDIYTLQRKRFYNDDWYNVGSFSRATSLSGEWRGTVAAGKYFYVKATPQGDTCVSKQLDGIGVRNDKTWASDKKSFTQTLYVYDEDSTELYQENKTFNTADSYQAGRDSVTHSPTIDNVWTSQSVPSGAELKNSLKTQYENAKEDGDYFCVRVNCNGVRKTYYCEP